MKSKANRRLLVVAVALAISVLGPPTDALAATGLLAVGLSRSELEGLVAMVHSPIRSGAAIVVGYDANMIFLVSARHVVSLDDSPYQRLAQSADIEVAFKFAARKYPATAVTLIDPGKEPWLGGAGANPTDLVGLRVAITPELAKAVSELRFDALADLSQTKPGAPVHTLAHEEVPWSWFETPDVFRKTQDHSLICETQTVGEGASGGAVVNERNLLLGMMQQIGKNAGSAYALTMSYVLGLAAKQGPVRLDVPKPVLSVVGEVPATVFVNGAVAGRTPVERKVVAVPGQYQVEIRAEGYWVWSSAVDLRPTSATAINYKLYRRFCGGWSRAVCIAGGATLVTGAAFGVATLVEKSAFDTTPSSSGRRNVERFGLVTDVLLSSALAAVIVTWLAGRSRSEAQLETER